MTPDAEGSEPESIIEDLDSELHVEQRSWWRSSGTRELVLGLLLLAGVLGWAGLTWWRNESDRSSYEQAQQAAKLRDWDRALALYSSASGYKDADTRASEASKEVQERDREYEATVKSLNGPAVITLQATRAVRNIQPGYKDIEVIAARAEQQVYDEALGGAVVMRTQAEPGGDGPGTVQPAGLYYREPGGDGRRMTGDGAAQPSGVTQPGAGAWVWLQGSDRWSMMRASGCGEWVLYDVPGEGWTPTPTSEATPAPDSGAYPIVPGSPDMKGRRLMAARVGRAGQNAAPAGQTARFESLSLDPAAYNYYACGAAGVWAGRYTPGLQQLDIPKGYLGNAMYEYEAVGDPLTSTVTMAGTQGVVADLGRQGAHVLLAGYGEPQGDSAVPTLYLAAPDGGNPRIVYTTTGTIVSALLSPDERHVLVVDAVALGVDKISLKAELLGADGRLPGSMLAEAVVDAPSGPGREIGQQMAFRLTMSGLFLRGGQYDGKLLLCWPDSASKTLRLQLFEPVSLMPSGPVVPLKEISLDLVDRAYLMASVEADGHTLLLMDGARLTFAEANDPSRANITLVQTGPSGQQLPAATVRTGKIELGTGVAETGGRPYMSGAALRGNTLVYVAAQNSKSSRSAAVYAVPASGLGSASPGTSTPAKPDQLFARSWQSSEGQPVPGASPPWYFGPSMFAYTDKTGVLHARTYDAGVDLALEGGIGAIYTPNSEEFRDVLR